MCLLFLLVCVDINVTTMYDGGLVKWEFGPCSSAQKYANYMKYTERCCVLEGYQTLTCYNTEKPQGWKNGYLEIQGRRYCDDFMSYKAMQRILVKGIYRGFFVYSLKLRINDYIFLYL